jgi:hypothetical protein
MLAMPLPPPHFNIKFIGGKLSNLVATRHLIGLDPQTIEWVYILQERRHATKKEIAALCAGKSESRLSAKGINRCFALTGSYGPVNLMAAQCFKKKDSNPPTCGVHNVPLINAKLPYELLATGLKAVTFLVCPVSGEVLTDRAPNPPSG